MSIATIFNGNSSPNSRLWMNGSSGYPLIIEMEVYIKIILLTLLVGTGFETLILWIGGFQRNVYGIWFGSSSEINCEPRILNGTHGPTVGSNPTHSQTHSKFEDLGPGLANAKFKLCSNRNGFGPAFVNSHDSRMLNLQSSHGFILVYRPNRPASLMNVSQLIRGFLILLRLHIWLLTRLLFVMQDPTTALIE